MTTLAITARGYAGEQDLPLIVQMLNRCEQADQLGEANGFRTVLTRVLYGKDVA